MVDTPYDSNILSYVSIHILQRIIGRVFVLSYNMLKDLVISRISICLEKRGSLQYYKSITGFLSLLYGIKKKSLFAQKDFSHLFLRIY